MEPMLLADVEHAEPKGPSAVPIAQLVVQELEPGVEDPSGHPVPPFVMMSKGIVTIETMTRMTR